MQKKIDLWKESDGIEIAKTSGKAIGAVAGLVLFGITLGAVNHVFGAGGNHVTG